MAGIAECVAVKAGVVEIVQAAEIARRELIMCELGVGNGPVSAAELLRAPRRAGRIPVKPFSVTLEARGVALACGVALQPFSVAVDSCGVAFKFCCVALEARAIPSRGEVAALERVSAKSAAGRRMAKRWSADAAAKAVGSKSTAGVETATATEGVHPATAAATCTETATAATDAGGVETTTAAATHMKTAPATAATHVEAATTAATPTAVAATAATAAATVRPGRRGARQN
jgi:hypothetical protein